VKIISADIYNVNLPYLSIWRPIILRLTTAEGIYGLGEVALAYGTGRLGGIGALREMIEGFVIGADPLRVESMWHTLFHRTFWGQGGGPVLYGAMSAIDEALLDIKGKALNVPVYDLLGGKTRDRIRVYANAWYFRSSADGPKRSVLPEEYAECAVEAVEDGFDALKFDPFFVGADGVVRPPEKLLSREMGDLAYARVAAVRDAVGPDIDILIEVHGNLTTTSAIEMGRRLSELDPFFYEEPVDAMNVECMRKVSENVPIPIAAGERLYTRYGFREYIEKQVVDILQPDLGLAGGLTEVKKIAAHAETYHLQIQPHNCGGPVSTAASVQLDASITNFVIQEWFPYRGPDFHELVTDAFESGVVDGEFAIPDEPGLGLVLNENAIAKYPSIHIE
jgi:galactonate dehydratase